MTLEKYWIREEETYHTEFKITSDEGNEIFRCLLCINIQFYTFIIYGKCHKKCQMYWEKISRTFFAFSRIFLQCNVKHVNESNSFKNTFLMF